jgi:uncharacterized LabA/DUF88 family protein
MAVTDDTSSALAILIDADNANPSIVQGLLAEVAKFGVATVKRIYGDWTLPNLGSWKAVLLDHSIQPIQQFRYTTGKNATDSAMIIDAMDLLYAGHLDGFCLVSSDSDFTKLASRLRESGKRVYGFGEQKTPRPFVAACDRFIYTEVFTQSQGDASRRRSTAELQRNKDLVGLLGSAIDAASDDSGWAHLGVVGSNLTKQAPDFDSRTYGYSKLSDLLDAARLFEVERQDKAIRVRRTAPRR